MSQGDPIQGELQEQIMRVLWSLGEARVEEVRQALPRSRGAAYTTVQTVMNRLAERRLLRRKRRGRIIYYSPRMSEADYLSRSLNRALAGASDEARRAALAQLVGEMERGELQELQGLAGQIDRRRRRS